ncbi:MAG: lamin tail domain-containing protein [Bacteroidales bacterium]|nr:lamin tail domain-containing protein [Bacteroidales bacterium]
MNKKLLLKILTGIIVLFFISLGINAQIIISQYVETNSGTTPKGIELWNISGNTIDFSTTNLIIKKGVNGNSPEIDVTVSTGTLNDDEVWVIGTSDIGTYLTDQSIGTNSYTEYGFSFNGNDALEVWLGDTKTDVFGNPGNDPGTAWTGNGVDTHNSNIALKEGITTGDTDGWTDPSERFETISTDNSLTGFGVAPTSSGPDETPPEFIIGYPKAANISETSFNVVVQLNEAGTAYFLKLDDGTDEPTPAEVMVGTSITVSSPSTSYSETISGLTAETAYDVYFVAEDDETTPNVQAAVTKLDITTTAGGGPTATDLLFSEYVEPDGGNNKALEIYNGTDEAISLGDYRIKIIHNGVFEDEYYTFPDGASIESYDVFVVANAGAISDILLVTDDSVAYEDNTVASFNGNDARILEKTPDSGTNWNTIDIIGEESGDPGDGWNVAGVTNATSNHTMVRKTNVTQGNTDWSASAGTNADNSEWIVYDANTFDYIGYHGFSPENDILTFELTEQTKAAEIDNIAHTVLSEVGFGTNLTALEPTITVSAGAQVSPTGAQDFMEPFVYTVTAENETPQDWTVTVTVAPVSVETDILTFVLTEQTGDAIIDTTNHTVAVEVAVGTDVTSLKPTIELSYGATVSPDTSIACDFTDPVVYTVTAEDGTTSQEWIATITVQVIDMVSIYDIQYNPDNTTDSSLYTGQTIMTTGIITAIYASKGFYLQDSASAWNGIYVYSSLVDTAVVGDSITFFADVIEYYNLTELKNVENYTIVSSGNELPEPVIINPGDMGEAYEGVLIKVENVICVNVDFDTHHNSLYVKDGYPNDTLMVHTQMYSFDPVLNYEYTFTGLGNYDWSNYKLEPRDTNDVEILVVVNNPPVIENVEVSPQNPHDDTDFDVLADITDDIEVIEKHFYYGSNIDNINTEVTLVEVGFAGIRFKATVPQQEVGIVYYKFTASDVENDVIYVDSVTITPVGVEEITLFDKIDIYPNPFNEIIYLNNVEQIKKIVIYNIIGQDVLHVDGKEKQLIKINTTELKDGLYIISIFDINGNIKTKKIIKN